MQFSGATTLSSNSAAAVSQATGAVNTAVTTAAAASGSGNSAQIQPINVPQTVGVSGSNIVMVGMHIYHLPIKYSPKLSSLFCINDKYELFFYQYRWYLELGEYHRFNESLYLMQNSWKKNHCMSTPNNITAYLNDDRLVQSWKPKDEFRKSVE